MSGNETIEEGSIAGGSFLLAVIDLGEALRALEKNREKIDENIFAGLFENYQDGKWSLVDKYSLPTTDGNANKLALCHFGLAATFSVFETGFFIRRLVCLNHRWNSA